MATVSTERTDRFSMEEANGNCTSHEIAHKEQNFIRWVLILPLVFFATHGVFSFQVGFVGDEILNRATYIIPEIRQPGILGYVVLPGIAYGVVMCSLLFNIRGIARVALQNKALTFLGILTILSAAWSQNPIRSLLNGSFYMIGTLFAYYLVLRFSPEEIMNHVMRCGIAVCLLSGIMIYFFPQHGTNTWDARTIGAWVGIFSDRVSAAKCMVYLMSPGLIFGLGRRRWKNFAYIALLIIFIVMAKAVSAILVTIVFALIMSAIQISRRLERNLALLMGAGILVFCIAFAVFGVPLIAKLFGVFGRDMTLTGRTTIWAILMDSIMKRPLLGYGFYAFWQGLTGESAHVILAAHWFFGYAHNGLLEIVLQLGLVGTSIFLFTFVNGCYDAWYCIRYGRSAGIEWYCGLLVLAVLYNIDEETVLWPNDLLSMLYIVACCGLASESRRIRSERASIAYSETFMTPVDWIEAGA